MDPLVSSSGATRRSVTFDETHPSSGATTNARASLATRTSARSRTPSASSVRSTSSRGSSASKSRSHSIQPASSDRPQRSSSAASRRPGGKKAAASASSAPKPPPDPLAEITSRALNSLQIPTLKSMVASANRARPKERRAMLHKVQAAVLRAHQDGSKAMERVFFEESEGMFELFLRESLVVHSREIGLLQNTLVCERANAQRRLEHAADTTETLFNGVASLLDAARAAGSTLCEESGIFASCRGEERSSRRTTQGRPMPEVRDQQASWFPEAEGGTHGPQRISDAERDALRQIQAFFGDVSDGVRGHPVVAGPAGGTQKSIQFNVNDMKALGSTSSSNEQAPISVSAAALRTELGHLTDAFSALLNQLRTRDEKQRHQITAQTRVLDEHATRLKLADDVLRDTVQQDHREASYTVQRLQELDTSLRARMDAVEDGTQLALSALIADKTDVCIDNNVYSDQAALLQYREDSVHRFMTRMEGFKLEQANILRTVQDELIEMSRREAQHGREEKVIATHSTLPSTTRAVLEQTCDRDTLLRLLHHITLHSDEATHLLLGAVSEYEQYLATNPAEADAVRDAARTHAAVEALMTKMYEESLIASNPHDVRVSLPETLEHMVEQYNTFMDFNVDHAKATLRQQEHRAAVDAQRQPHKLGHGGFFDETVALPACMVQADGGTNPNPYSTVLYDPRTLDRTVATTAAARATTADVSASRKHAAVGAVARRPTPPSAQPRAGDACGSGRAVAESVVALQRAHPSDTDPKRAATMSVVGDGRWGGAAAVYHGTNNNHNSHNNNNDNNRRSGKTAEGMRSGGEALAQTLPVLPPVTGRQASSLTLAVAETTARRAVPAPAVPPRKYLTEHVLSEYGHDVDGALAVVRDHRSSAVSSPAPVVAERRDSEGGEPVAAAYVPGSIRTTFAPLIMGEDTTSDAARTFPPKRRQLAYQDGDSEYIEKQRHTFSVFAAPNVNYT